MMKQRARVLFTILFAFMAISVFAEGWLQVTGNSVRLRAKPDGTDTGLRVNTGDKLQWLDYDNGWYKVQYGKKVVYISSKYVKRISQEQNKATVVVTGDKVIMRTSPGGKDSGLRTNKGDRYQYCGKSGDWYKILHKGNYYWVNKNYAVIKQ